MYETVYFTFENEKILPENYKIYKIKQKSISSYSNFEKRIWKVKSYANKGQTWLTWCLGNTLAFSNVIDLSKWTVTIHPSNGTSLNGIGGSGVPNGALVTGFYGGMAKVNTNSMTTMLTVLLSMNQIHCISLLPWLHVIYVKTKSDENSPSLSSAFNEYVRMLVVGENWEYKT